MRFSEEVTDYDVELSHELILQSRQLSSNGLDTGRYSEEDEDEDQQDDGGDDQGDDGDDMFG